jgi:hypothetical protein
VTPRLLSDDEVLDTFSHPMRRMEDPNEAAPVNLRDYFAEIPAVDFGGHDCSAHDIFHVYVDARGRFEHVLVSSENPNVFMAVIVDRKDRKVYGHQLLNLREKYGLET